MRVLGVALAAATLALFAGMSSTAAPAGKASLQLLTLQPLTVRGQGFAARERVRIEVYGVARATRRLTATRFGTFRTRFDGVTATRCDMVRLVAVGGAGSRASTKMLPAPACLAE
jgi:hypothetical protein